MTKKYNSMRYIFSYRFARLFLCVILFSLCGMISGCGSNDSSDKSEPKSEFANVISDKDYQEAVNLAKIGRWHDCVVKLVRYHKGDERSGILFAYVNAQEQFSKNDMSMAKFHLDKIPNDYSGEFADEIKQLKEIVPEKAEQEKIAEQTQREEQERERASNLYIGDPESKIQQVFGTPDRVNRHVSQYAERKQYVYYRNNKAILIYTEDGFVTDFQD